MCGGGVDKWVFSYGASEEAPTIEIKKMVLLFGNIRDCGCLTHVISYRVFLLIFIDNINFIPRHWAGRFF